MNDDAYRWQRRERRLWKRKSRQPVHGLTFVRVSLQEIAKKAKAAKKEKEMLTQKPQNRKSNHLSTSGVY